ncbi:hypothetical protein IKE71_00575 [Candidatus Saccharibacteria bacterium]|nr:hypothetical protein [Candidatus Saccharibacteria bacterium]
MAPKKTITMRDLVENGNDPRVQDVFNRALKRAYEYQQETLKKAKKP